jgi:hypothetical protein
MKDCTCLSLHRVQQWSNNHLSFPRTLAYIGRYELAQREAVAEGIVYQVLADERGYFLVRIRAEGKRRLAAAILKGRRSQVREKLLARFVERSFGSDEVLTRFYHSAKNDPVLAHYCLNVFGWGRYWK